MQYNEIVKSIEDTYKTRVELFKKKSDDYADADALSNFKRMAIICKELRVDVTTPFGCAMFLKLLKIDRITNLCTKGAKPSNESIEDSFVDEMNYTDLAKAILKE